MAGIQAVFYRDRHGVEPVAQFIETLPVKRRAKVYAFIEEHLNGRSPDAPPPEHPVTSQIRGEMREVRVRFGNTRYRILYQRSGNLLVLLCAFEKNTGAVPRSQIETAEGRMADFKTRMDARHRRPPRAVGRDVPPRRLKP
ncbi:MAG TPA: type II toxin-antitoxin system RelE/ParE family toxin [Solirubrobacterales bacterium]|nr:type II toxin-antitoxin system RelE/ParE family toxin [Solirubrobacterales bacterium]